MHPALIELMGGVADEPRWSAALAGYVASFGAELLGGAFLASSLDQLERWGAEFAAHPDLGYWLRTPADAGAPTLLAMGVTPAAARSYAAHYRARDPLWQVATRQSTAVASPRAWVVTDSLAWSPGRRVHSEIETDFLHPHGIGERLFAGGCGAPHNAGQLYLSLYRAPRQGRFTPRQVQRFQGELAVVQRAASLHREVVGLRARTQALEGMMDQLPVGLLFWDSAGRLLHANERMRTLWRAPQPSAWQQHLQRGRALAGTMPARLRQVFEQALQGHSACVVLDAQHLLVSLPIGSLGEWGLSATLLGVAWVVLHRQGGCANAVAMARQAYRLSPSEAELLLALMQGQSPPAFAQARGSRISTVRTQLSALLAKTGTSRQQDLVALVARLASLAPSATP